MTELLLHMNNYSIFFFFLRILNILNTQTRGEGRKIFKETYKGVYPKGLTFRYTAHVLNLFYSYSFFNVGLTHYFFFLRILSIFNTHIHGKRGEGFLKKFTVMYIQKGLILGSIFFLLRILNIFNTHTRGEERRFF